MIRKLHWIYAASAAVLIAGGCMKPSAISLEKPPMAEKTAPTTQSVEVRIDNFTFMPETITVTPGTKVTWINRDDVPHTATSVTKAFASPALDTDDKFSFTFTQPGTFPYFCAVHPHMTGQIIVK